MDGRDIRCAKTTASCSRIMNGCRSIWGLRADSNDGTESEFLGATAAAGFLFRRYGAGSSYDFSPTACAVGCSLSPLSGCVVFGYGDTHCRRIRKISAMKDPNALSPLDLETPD